MKIWPEDGARLHRDYDAPGFWTIFQEKSRVLLGMPEGRQKLFGSSLTAVSSAVCTLGPPSAERHFLAIRGN